MNEKISSDEVSIKDLFNVLRRYVALLLCLPLICAVLAAILSFIALRPMWEASAVIEVGQVAQLGSSGGQLGQPGQITQVPVEPIANVITRLMLPTLVNGASLHFGVKPEEANALKGYYSTLKVDQISGADLIKIKIRGPSAEISKKLIQSCIEYLQNTHSRMMAVSIDRNLKQLNILKDDIHNLTIENMALRTKLLSSHNWNAFDATLSATLLNDKSVELRNMIQKKLMLEELQSPSRSYTTRVIDEIFVSEDPVSPNKQLIIGLAILLGLFGAVVVAFIHNALFAKSST
jgi:capsular polysaccharide biosynthesis protein